MLTKDLEILNFRAIAILAIIVFIPTLILGIANPGSTIGSSLGILGMLLPSSFLIPSGILLIVWLGLLAWRHKTTPT